MPQVRAPRNKEEKGRGNWGARTGLPTTPPSSRTSACKLRSERLRKRSGCCYTAGASNLLSADFCRRELHFWELLWGLSCSPKALVARCGYNTRFLPPTLPTSGLRAILPATQGLCPFLSQLIVRPCPRRAAQLGPCEPVPKLTAKLLGTTAVLSPSWCCCRCGRMHAPVSCATVDQYWICPSRQTCKA